MSVQQERGPPKFGLIPLQPSAFLYTSGLKEQVSAILDDLYEF